VDFLGLLRNLFGGGQKPAAPPPMIARPASQQEQPAPSFLQRVQSAPAARQGSSPFPFQTAAPQSFPSFPAPPPRQAQQPQQQQQNNTGPWRTLNFAPPPANAPTPLDLQKPQLEEPMFMRGQKEAKKQVETKKAAEAQNEFFGGKGQYAPEQMSVDAYLQLSPQQRAAVDANTALIQAAEEDKASWAKQQVAGKPIEDQDYLGKVKGKFGDAGGSNTYAPRTLAVLDDLGLDLQGKDLDQYLNYSALVTADDLNTLKPGAAASSPRQQNAVAFAEKASARLSETLASGQTLLDSIRANSDTGRQLFGEPASTDRVGFTNGERDADLKQAFDILSQTRSQQDLTPETVGGLYTELQEKHGVTPNEVAQYFETRLQANEYLNAAEDSSVTLGGPTSSLEYLSPADFRSKYLTRGA
jgi:hypothetical protein